MKNENKPLRYDYLTRHLYSLNEVKFLKITFHFKHFYNMLSIFSWSLKLNILLWRKIEEET